MKNISHVHSALGSWRLLIIFSHKNLVNRFSLEYLFLSHCCSTPRCVSGVVPRIQQFHVTRRFVFRGGDTFGSGTRRRRDHRAKRFDGVIYGPRCITCRWPVAGWITHASPSFAWHDLGSQSSLLALCRPVGRGAILDPVVGGADHRRGVARGQCTWFARTRTRLRDYLENNARLLRYYPGTFLYFRGKKINNEDMTKCFVEAKINLHGGKVQLRKRAFGCGMQPTRVYISTELRVEHNATRDDISRSRFWY